MKDDARDDLPPTQPLPQDAEPDVPGAADTENQGKASDSDATQPLPSSDDPLSVFDEPAEPPTREDTAPIGAARAYPDPLRDTSPTPVDTTSPAGAGAYVPSAPAGATPTDQNGAAPAVRTGPRTWTIVWGFLVVALGAGLLADAAGVRFDGQLAAIGLLATAGVVLVAGSLVSAFRRRARD
jgi:hypothetical protein